MMRRITKYPALALALTLPLSACDNDSGLAVDNGRVSIQLTDAAGDFEAAVVTISEIYLQGGDGDEGEEEGGRVVLRDEPVTTDLLTLANDVEALVEGAVVPAGTYAQLRFVITGGYIAVENAAGDVEVHVTDGYEPPAGFDFPDGSEVAGTLQCPSCSESGLKVNLAGGALVAEGAEEVLLADFDVAQSFGKEAGQSGQWVMTPVIKAIDLGGAASVHVSVQLGGEVTLPEIDGVQLTLGAFKAALTNGGGSTEKLGLSDEDEDGVYEAEFRFLIPGSYNVALVVPAGVTIATNPALPVTPAVGAGATAEAEVIVTSASGS